MCVCVGATLLWYTLGLFYLSIVHIHAVCVCTLELGKPLTNWSKCLYYMNVYVPCDLRHTRSVSDMWNLFGAFGIVFAYLEQSYNTV